ncbi:MAG: hypothetical protein FWH20_00420 [Oscillospiraceae bacterium]|nr:hypothetical protein [Oscillospiraceae bacterium]
MKINKLNIIKWLAIIAITVILFLCAKKHAYEFRGYEAIGGEYIILLLPVIFVLIRKVVKDWLNRWRAACEEVKRDDT